MDLARISAISLRGIDDHPTDEVTVTYHHKISVSSSRGIHNGDIESPFLAQRSVGLLVYDPRFVVTLLNIRFEHRQKTLSPAPASIVFSTTSH